MIYPNIPIVGIEPAVKPAVTYKPGGQVLVMATPMTIREEKFRTLMGRYSKQAKIIPLPCPGLMDFVERGDLYSEDFRKYLEELLYEYRTNKIDAAVLGCTHYPFLRDVIERVVAGREVLIIDSGEAVEKRVESLLDENDLRSDATLTPQYEFLTFADEEYRRRLEQKARTIVGSR